MKNIRSKLRPEKILAWLKGFFTTNILTKILSVIAAVVIWVIIINIDDPVLSKSFSVPVTTTNMDVLRSVNKVYEISSGDIAKVTCKGKKSVIDRISKKDIVAIADLSELSSVNAVQIKPKISAKYRDKVTLTCKSVLKVSLEELAEKNLKVDVQINGSVTNGYALGNVTARPNMVEVSGGSSVINNIASVKVVVDVSDKKENFTTKVEPQAYDKEGEKVESDTLEFSEDEILVVGKVLNTKTVPVNVQIHGKPAEGNVFESVTCLPENVTVAGNVNKLSKIKELKIDINIDGLTASSDDLEKNIETEDYLPDGIIALPDYQKLSIKINIEGSFTKSISVPVSDIEIKYLPEGFKAEIDYDEAFVTAEVTGLKNQVSILAAEDLEPYIDLSDVTEEGKITAELKISDNDDYGLANIIKIPVVITGSSGNTDNPEETIAPEQTEEPDANNGSDNAGDGGSDSDSDKDQND
ncbi:MAG: CdaR family protein [Lachnospiraceae bacterium]|jgi:YbbR domain-containing protein|nr:CdaR family protein [Lachnospiraceae bacterium]MEE3461896.1 CdaR family protein [Lachnospiraceae bacterium]